MMQEKRDHPVRVDIVAVPEVTPTAMYGMFEILSSVGVVWPLLKEGRPGTPVFDVALVSADGRPFTTLQGSYEELSHRFIQIIEEYVAERFPTTDGD